MPPHVCSLEVECIGEIDTPVLHIGLLNIDQIALHAVVWWLFYRRLLRFEWRRTNECHIIQIGVIVLMVLPVLMAWTKFLEVSVGWLYGILHKITTTIDLGTNGLVFAIILG
jgi:hypothetical protein